MAQIFIVGGQRCGSTFLLRQFSKIPNVFSTFGLTPEPKYFLPENFVSKEHYYETVFGRCSDEMDFSVEKSTTYYEREDALRLIQKEIPESKILFVMRDPIQRACSNYWFSVSNNLEKRSIDEALVTEKTDRPNGISTSPFSYVQRSRYKQYLDTINSIFRGSQVRYLIFEEIVSDQKKILDLLESLGISSGGVQLNSTPENVSNHKTNPISEYTKNLLMEELKEDYFAVAKQIGYWPEGWRKIE